MLPLKLRDYMVKNKGKKRYGSDLISVPPEYKPAAKTPGIELSELPSKAPQKFIVECPEKINDAQVSTE